MGLVLTQLQNQRSDISGVSLDEEAANLIQYQRAYEAAAEVVAAINSVTSDFLDNPADCVTPGPKGPLNKGKRDGHSNQS